MGRLPAVAYGDAQVYRAPRFIPLEEGASRGRKEIRRFVVVFGDRSLGQTGVRHPRRAVAAAGRQSGLRPGARFRSSHTLRRLRWAGANPRSSASAVRNSSIARWRSPASKQAYPRLLWVLALCGDFRAASSHSVT